MSMLSSPLHFFQENMLAPVPFAAWRIKASPNYNKSLLTIVKRDSESRMSSYVCRGTSAQLDDLSLSSQESPDWTCRKSAVRSGSRTSAVV